MHLMRTTVMAALASLAVATTALAQGPCDLVIKQAAEVMGAAAGKSERFKPTATAEVCNVRSGDNSASVRLTIMADKQPGLTLMTQKTIAQQSADPDQRFSAETGLGADAFSLREKDKIAFFMRGAERVLSVGLGKDRGITDADVERARQFAKQLLAAK